MPAVVVPVIVCMADTLEAVEEKLMANTEA